jgi:hypothetical protein
MRNLVLCLLFLAACGSSDPTFMGVCDTGSQIYLPIGDAVNSSVCENPTAITWPSLPLVVELDADVSVTYDSSVSSAMDFWNNELGFTAFTTHGPTAQVHVTIGSAGSGGDGATSFYYDEEGKLNALVELRRPGDITEVYYIMAHELGHSLGLCHDADDYESVMYPELDYAWSDPDQDFRVIVVTDNDKNALRAKY